MTGAVDKARELARRLTVESQIKRYQPYLQRAAVRGYNVERAIQQLVRQVKDNPLLAKCDMREIVARAHQAITLGLELGPEMGEAWLIPYRIKGKLTPQLIVGYRGFVTLAYRAGVKSLVARCVHERDAFRVTFTDEGDKIEHTPCLTGDRGDVIAAYAIAVTQDGGRVCCVLSREDIEKRRAASRAKSVDSPWERWFEEMCIKSVIRYMRRYLPMSPEFMKADQLETLLEIGEPQPMTIEPIIEEERDADTGTATDGEDSAHGSASGSPTLSGTE